MPRGSVAPRMLWPDAALSESLASVSVGAQLLFDRLVVTADDQGRHQDGAARVWAECFPRMRKIRESDVEKWLEELSAGGMIERYVVDGERLIQLRTWWEWQRLEWARASRFPAPEGWSDRTGKRPSGDGRTSPDASGVVRQNGEEKRERKNRESGPASAGRGGPTKSFRELVGEIPALANAAEPKT